MQPGAGLVGQRIGLRWKDVEICGKFPLKESRKVDRSEPSGDPGVSPAGQWILSRQAGQMLIGNGLAKNKLAKPVLCWP